MSMNIENFINDVVRNNVRSSYMTTLYCEKKREIRYLSADEQNDYLVNCAMLDATSRIMLPTFKRLLADIPVSQLNEQGRKILSDNVSIDEEVVNQKTSMEEQQDMIKNNYKGMYGYGSDESYYFGRLGISEIVDVVGHYTYNMSGYDELCNQAFLDLLGCNSLEEAVTELSQIVSGIDSLPVEQQSVIFDKVGICFGRGTTLASSVALYDKEYSKIKYPSDSECFDKYMDYGELLATVGIDMGEMPKTFVGEIYGYKNKKH